MQDLVNLLKPDVILVCDDGLKGFFLPSLITTKAKWIYERHASQELNRQKGFLGRWSSRLMQIQASKFDSFVVLTNANREEWRAKKCGFPENIERMIVNVNLRNQLVINLSLLENFDKEKSLQQIENILQE